MIRSWRGSVGLLLMSLSTTVALARLVAHGLRPGVIAPMALAVVVADVSVLVAMRFRLPLALAIISGAVLSFAALVIALDPTVVNPASAHFAHWSSLSAQERAARFALADDGTPLPALVGVIVALGALGGLAASATRAIWESQLRRGHPVRGQVGPLSGCIAPSFGIFVYSTLVSANQGRVPASLCYLVGAACFVVLSDRSGVDVREARSWRFPSGALAGALAVLLVVLLAGSSLSSMRLSVFHVTPPSGQGGGHGSGSQAAEQLLTGTALVDNLRSLDISDSNEVVFHATSSLPTYWQVGTLTDFDGTEWLPSPQVQSALAGDSAISPASFGPALPAPSNGERFSPSVDITDFASRLLPAPPSALSVSGISGGQVVAQEGVLAPSVSGAGTSYTVTALLPPTHPTSTAQLPLNDPRLAPYLALPAEPEIVSFLAHEVVGHAATQGAEAQALVNWFRSGKFRYTLNPPATTGTDPLVQFLTVTHAGYCQQFAGAFGIMARTLGIPTRLVVGFIAGQPGPAGHYTVTGADAHVWPQVYLGPGSGWISVEPTPPASGDTVTPAAVVGPTSAAATKPASSTPTSGGSATPTTVTTVPQLVTPTPTGGFPWLLVLVLVLVLGALGATGTVLWRRRGGRGIGGSPNQGVVLAWERAQRALRRRGLARRPAETPGEYAARLEALEQRTDRRVGAEVVAQLARLVEQACYTPWPCTPEQARSAQGWAASLSGRKGS
jgi:transglutaminase-like putative cysteine protease